MLLNSGLVVAVFWPCPGLRVRKRAFTHPQLAVASRASEISSGISWHPSENTWDGEIAQVTVV